MCMDVDDLSGVRFLVTKLVQVSLERDPLGVDALNLRILSFLIVFFLNCFLSLYGIGLSMGIIVISMRTRQTAFLFSDKKKVFFFICLHFCSMIHL